MPPGHVAWRKPARQASPCRRDACPWLIEPPRSFRREACASGERRSRHPVQARSETRSAVPPKSSPSAAGRIPRCSFRWTRPDFATSFATWRGGWPAPGSWCCFPIFINAPGATPPTAPACSSFIPASITASPFQGAGATTKPPRSTIGSAWSPSTAAASTSIEVVAGQERLALADICGRYESYLPLYVGVIHIILSTACG